MKCLHAISVLVAFGIATASAFASPEASTIETDGGTVTLHVAPDLDGHLRGALSFDLEPGWKTYWRDPGASGIHPSVALAGASGAVESVEIHYPVPHWIMAPYGDWAGYSEPVTFPLTFTTGALPPSGEVSLTVFAGICAEVCIPVTGTLTAQFSMTTSDATAMAAVNAAFAALPEPGDDNLHVADVTSLDDGNLQVTIDGDVSGLADPAHALFAHAEVNETGRTISLKRPKVVSVSDRKIVYALDPARAISADETITLHLTVAGKDHAIATDIETVLKAAK